MNEKIAADILTEKIRRASALPTLAVWSANNVMPRTAANYQSVAKRVMNLVDAFPELMTDEIRELTTIE